MRKKTNLMGLKSILLFIGIIFFLFGIVRGRDLFDNRINFKNIYIQQGKYIRSNYSSFKKLYPKYPFYVPDNYFVNNRVDISFNPKDFKLIEIHKKKYFPESLLNYDVVLHFNSTSQVKINEFTKKKFK